MQILHAKGIKPNSARLTKYGKTVNFRINGHATPGIFLGQLAAKHWTNVGLKARALAGSIAKAPYNSDVPEVAKTKIKVETGSRKNQRQSNGQGTYLRS